VVIHASLAEDAVEQIWEDCGSDVGVLIVGDPEREKDQVVQGAKENGMIVRYWEELWEGAESSKKVMPGKLGWPKSGRARAHTLEPQPQDIHSYFYTEGEGDSSPVVVSVTHQVDHTTAC